MLYYGDLDICSAQSSPIHHVGKHGISNRDTHLYPLHDNLSVLLTAIEVWLWLDHQRNVEWLDNTMRLCTFFPDIGTHSPGIALARTAGIQLNHLRTSVKCFCSCT